MYLLCVGGGTTASQTCADTLQKAYSNNLSLTKGAVSRFKNKLQNTPAVQIYTKITAYFFS